MPCFLKISSKACVVSMPFYCNLYTAKPDSEQILELDFFVINSETLKSSFCFRITPPHPGKFVVYADIPISESIFGITLLSL